MPDDNVTLDHTIQSGGRGNDLNITLTIAVDSEVKRLIQRMVRVLEKK